MKLIVDQGNDFILQVKGNQGWLEHECELIPKRKTAIDNYSSERSMKRNRREQRSIEVYDRNNCDTPEADHWGEYVSNVIVVKRKTRVKDTKRKCYDMRQETAFYVSNKLFSAEECCKIIRGHRGIENEVHCVRDISMHEDKSRIRKNPDKIFMLRSWGLNIMRHYGVTNIAKAMDESHLSLDILLQKYPGII